MFLSQEYKLLECKRVASVFLVNQKEIKMFLLLMPLLNNLRPPMLGKITY